MYPKQAITVSSDFELFSALRKNDVGFVLLVPKLELKLEKTILKLKSEWLQSLCIGVISLGSIVVDEDCSYLIGKEWKTHFEEWFNDFYSGKVSKIRSSRKNDVNNPIDILKRKLGIFRGKK